MFSRPALRTLFNLERVTCQQPIFSYASSRQQACLLHQASTTSSPQNFQATFIDVPPPSITSRPAEGTTPIASKSQQQPSSTSPSPSSEEEKESERERELLSKQGYDSRIPRNKLPLPPIFSSNLKITASLASKLPYLQTQRPHYISAHLHDRPYLLTEGDHLRLPFLMPNVKSGDVLRFNRASVLGSRDYSLKGAPYIDERMFECRLRVLGVETEPLRIKEKTKRRRRHVQHIKSKHKYTVLRVMQVKVKSLEELLAEGAEIVQDDSLVENVDVIETKADPSSSSS